nr:hypothetical protein 7 [Desulfobulbaceae bacterium]
MRRKAKSVPRKAKSDELWTIRQLMAEPDGKSYSWYLGLIRMGLIKAFKIGSTYVITGEEKRRIDRKKLKLNRKLYLG